MKCTTRRLTLHTRDTVQLALPALLHSLLRPFYLQLNDLRNSRLNCSHDNSFSLHYS